MEMPGDWVFALAAGVAVGAGLLVVTQRNPIYSAIAMLACFLSIAVLYLKLDAPFLAAIHVLVYTGAILVLFLFVIMLLNLQPGELGKELPLPARGAIALLCLGLFAALAAPLVLDGRAFGELASNKDAFGSVEQVGRSLFTDKRNVLAFELISVLILTAVFGGVLLAKRKL